MARKPTKKELEKISQIQKTINKGAKEGNDIAQQMGTLLQKNLDTQKELNATIENRAKTLENLLTIEEHIENIDEKINEHKSEQVKLDEKIKHYQDIGHGMVADGLKINKQSHQAEIDRLYAIKASNEAVQEGVDRMMAGIRGTVDFVNRIPVIGKLITTSLGFGEKNLQKMQENLTSMAVGEKPKKLSSLFDGMEGASGKTLTKLGGVAILVGGIVVLWKVFSSILKAYSEHIDKLGEEFGVMGTQDLAEPIIGARHEAIMLGKDTADLIEITKGLSDEFGLGVKQAAGMSGEILNSGVAMGLANSEASKLYGILIVMGRQSQAQAEYLAESTYQLARANDVAPDAVMKDMAESAEVFAKYSRDGGINIADAAVEARKYGMSLSDMDSISEHMLNFQEAITAEATASAVLGKNINMDRVRELIMLGKNADAMKEIRNVLGEHQNILESDPITRGIIAKTIGGNITLLNKMMQAEKETVEQMDLWNIKGEDGQSIMTEVMNKFNSLAAILIETVGPKMQEWIGALNVWLESGGMERMVDWVERMAKGIASFANNLDWVLGGLGTVAGFMVGGPWGAAIGGGLGFGLGNKIKPPIELHSLSDSQAARAMGANVPATLESGEMVMTEAPLHGMKKLMEKQLEEMKKLRHDVVYEAPKRAGKYNAQGIITGTR